MSATRIALGLALALASTGAASAARSDWAPAEQSQLRLLLAGPESGHLAGGIEIVLEPGWYTYWRNPGEAGVPPAFDFSGSENVAGIEVSYPVPERYDDGASVSLIYRDEVVFPIAVTPMEPGRPVRLQLEASFGVCREVCIPTEARASVESATPPVSDALTHARLERFRPRVPKPAEPGRFDVERVSVEGDTLWIDVRMPDSSYLDLFADPPPGWFIGQPEFVARDEGVARYRLPLVGRPHDAPLTGQRFRFVAVAGGEAIEKSVQIQ